MSVDGVSGIDCSEGDDGEEGDDGSVGDDDVDGTKEDRLREGVAVGKLVYLDVLASMMRLFCVTMERRQELYNQNPIEKKLLQMMVVEVRR